MSTQFEIDKARLIDARNKMLREVRRLEDMIRAINHAIDLLSECTPAADGEHLR